MWVRSTARCKLKNPRPMIQCIFKCLCVCLLCTTFAIQIHSRVWETHSVIASNALARFHYNGIHLSSDSQFSLVFVCRAVEVNANGAIIIFTTTIHYVAIVQQHSIVPLHLTLDTHMKITEFYSDFSLLFSSSSSSSITSRYCSATSFNHKTFSYVTTNIVMPIDRARCPCLLCVLYIDIVHTTTLQ